MNGFKAPSSPQRNSGGVAALAFAAAGLVLFSMVGCSGEQAASASNSAAQSQSAGEDVPRIETVEVRPCDLTKTVEMPGTVEGFETADLYAKVGGYLKEIYVDIGEPIEKDQVLALLYIPEMQKELEQKLAAAGQAEAKVDQAKAAIDQAKADLASAQAAFEEAEAERAEKLAELDFRRTQYERYEKLVENKALYREKFDEAKFQLGTAEAALGTVEARIRTAKAQVGAAEAHSAKVHSDFKAAQAARKLAQANVEYVRTMMQYAEIKAPFNGVVTRRYVHPGAFIQPAEGNSAAKPLLTVSRTDIVRIFLDIPMNDVRLLDRGDRAVLSRINVLPGHQVEGEVTRYATVLETQSRMMRVEIDLSNPDGVLRPGYYGYVTVFLEELPQAPVVPSSALLTEGDEHYVYVVRDGQAHRQTVEVNYQDGTIVGISLGLQGGEQVVRAGGGVITNGQRVQAVPTQWQPTVL